MNLYPALVHKDEDSDYGVSFPDFPGCVTGDATLEGAYELALEALQAHIEDMQAHGEPIPSPTPLREAVALGHQEAALTILMIPTAFRAPAPRPYAESA
jgi:predicted RNase H-like HicB family nuclease